VGGDDAARTRRRLEDEQLERLREKKRLAEATAAARR